MGEAGLGNTPLETRVAQYRLVEEASVTLLAALCVALRLDPETIIRLPPSRASGGLTSVRWVQLTFEDSSGILTTVGT